MKKQITRLENDLKTIDTLRELDSEKEYADLILEKMGNFGAPLAKFEGEFIEVLNGIPGEKVRARIYRFYRKKKQITACASDYFLFKYSFVIFVGALWQKYVK